MLSTIRPERLVKSGTGRYTVLLVGLGATGVALGWLGPQTRHAPQRLTRRLSQGRPQALSRPSGRR
ncbi:hypothetical protein ACFVH6_36515 [Spirillospora sp. NPDC127200]